MTAPELWNPIFPPRSAQAHLVGICGAGMKALAEYLHDRGWQLTGSDQDPEPRAVVQFQQRGISVQRGHAATNVSGNISRLIHSPAISATNCERQSAVEQGIPVLSYVAALAELTRQSETFAIAGTHGKSTTTAMLGTILAHANRSPSVICGAEIIAREANGWAGASSQLVVEACEFRRHFLELRPTNCCLLGIEPDHFDCYPDLQSAVTAYAQFCQQVPVAGTIVYRIDCEATKAAIAQVARRRVSYALDHSDADWGAVGIRVDAQITRFALRHGITISREVRLQVPGRHNVMNAVAAAACAEVLGISLPEIVEGLEAYQGLKRRMEYRGLWQGIPVYDDYAHHPTEIRAALSAVREMFPGKRLICVFQSHQISRTEALLDEFAAALSLADRVYVLPIFAAREAEDGQAVSVAQKLLGKITSFAEWIAALDQVWGTLQTDDGNDNDAVILTLGAGNLTRVHL